MDVILPQQIENGQIGLQSHNRAAEFPVLYLLHGLSDDQTIWQRRTSIERYAAPLGLAVIMPNVNRSFYTDMRYGYAYWTFVSEELPRIANGFFRLSPQPKNTFVAGLSMGGYGAFKLALSQPERFAAAASLSGTLDLATRLQAPELLEDTKLVFGAPSAIQGSENDLFWLAEQAAKQPQIPQLYQCCGTEDHLYVDNIRFRNHTRNLGLSLIYEESAGAHEWGYWDEQIQKVLAWLPLQTSLQIGED